jgi:hypothetical protein
MPCEIYREALTEAAASGFDSNGALRAHFESCAACRAFFTEEQSLFSSIDAGVRSAANAEVPADFLPRLRARLDEETIPQRRWVFAPAALATAAVLLAALAVVRVGQKLKQPQLTSPTQTASSTSPSRVVPLRVETSARAARRIVTNRSPHQVVGARETTVEVPEVLIPPGQKEAVALLLASLRVNEHGEELLMAAARSSGVPIVQISPLDVSPLEVKPLDDLAGPKN